jgi:hypothetical protein
MIPAALWIASLLLVAAPQKAPKADAYPPPGDCHDDDMVDRCSAGQQRKVRELFGVKSIEAHRDAGDQVRRAFYVDGYGNDVVAISFVRPKSGDPVLWVHFLRQSDGSRAEPLTAPVPEAIWQDLIRRSSHFDRRLVAPPKVQSESGDITLCMHSWVFTVEATDPAGKYEPAILRRTTEDACDNGLGEAFATELQRAAVPLLAPCDRLDRARHRNEATLLSACRLLRGDRLAAAEVMNQLEWFRNVDEPEDKVLLAGQFAYDARLDWAGEQIASAGSAAEAWARKVTEGGRANLFYEFIEGQSADRVRFVGLLSRAVEGESVYRRARVEQIWTRNGSRFEIETATVGPFEPETKP